MAKPIYDDPVVAEIHAIRAQMMTDCNGDHARLLQRVRDHQRVSHREIVSVPLRKQRDLSDKAD